MSFQALSWAMGKKTGDMAARLVLIALANYADDEGSCFPSISKLALDCECHPRTIIRALVRLGDGDEKKSVQGLGLVTRERRTNSRGGRTSDRYFLSLSDNLSKTLSDNVSSPKCQIVTPSKDEPITYPVSLKKGVRATTPEIALGDVLNETHVGAVIEHRKRLGKPLTVYAAGLLAKRLADYHDPDEAADEMITQGWATLKAGWVGNEVSPPKSGKRRRDGPAKLGKKSSESAKIGLKSVTSVCSQQDPELFKECERLRGCPVPVGPSGAWSFPNQLVDQAMRAMASTGGVS